MKKIIKLELTKEKWLMVSSDQVNPKSAHLLVFLTSGPKTLVNMIHDIHSLISVIFFLLICYPFNQTESKCREEDTRASGLTSYSPYSCSQKVVGTIGVLLLVDLMNG
jgi:hypothetical protein